MVFGPTYASVRMKLPRAQFICLSLPRRHLCRREHRPCAHRQVNQQLHDTQKPSNRN
jgi:hypothetical protein